MRIRLIRLLACSLLTLSLLAGPAIVADPSQTGLDAEALARIPSRMKEFVDQGTVAGVVTLVARHGKVAALDAVGYTDIETKQELRTDAIFQLHSMTKPVVSIGIMMLMEQGKLAITDAVQKHLPEFRGMWVIAERTGEGGGAERLTLKRPSRPISIRDLLTHTSGMPLNPAPGIGELHGALHKTLNETVLVMSQQPLGFEPGSRWQYSNTGMAALARIIEVRSGMAFEKFLETQIFKPLGMDDTYIYPPKEKFHRMPTAYILRDGKPVKYTDDPLGEGVMKFRVGAKYPLPEGGLYSTASDLFALYQMMLNGGEYDGARILSAASVELMTEVHTGDLATSSAGMGWGLGWSVVRDPGALGLPSVGTYGHGGRYGTFCLIDPKKDIIGVFLIHREGGSDERNAFVQLAMTAARD